MKKKDGWLLLLYFIKHKIYLNIKVEPKFYEDIHNYWSELQGLEITKVDAILNHVIWNNRFITIQKMLFRWEKCIQHNIMYIKDILSDNSNF